MCYYNSLRDSFTTVPTATILALFSAVEEFLTAPTGYTSQNQPEGLNSIY